MTTFAASAHPAGCAIAWATKNEILVEIPCAKGPPYIVRYKRTAKGLAEALNVMVKNEAKATYSLVDHPAVRRPIVGFSDSQREQARLALKRLKIT